MKKIPLVLETTLAEETLSQIKELRTARLNVAKKMLADVDDTAHTLLSRGLLDPAAGVTSQELRTELEYRVESMEARIKNPDMIYEDELNIYVDLLAEG